MSLFFLRKELKIPQEGSQIEDYILGPKIMETSCSRIYHATCTRTGQKKILKFIDVDTYPEYEIVKQCNHPNIIRFGPIIRTPHFIAIPMDCFDDGSARNLLDFQPSFTSGLPEEMARDIFFQTACALKYLHDQGIWHRDIKPENILISRANGRVEAVLSDFGFATRVQPGIFQMSGNYVGTPDYASPEIHCNVSYGAYSDIYALGVTLFVLLTNEIPIKAPPNDARNEKTLRKFCHKLFHNLFPYHLLESKGYYMAFDLIKRMCNPKIDERMTIDEVLNHPWVMGAAKTAAESDISKILFQNSEDDDYQVT